MMITLTKKEQLEIINMVYPFILKVTPQIYYEKKTLNGKINNEDIASGVFIGHNRKFFLITASHVVKWFDPIKLGVFANNNFLYLINNKNIDYNKLKIKRYKDLFIKYNENFFYTSVNNSKEIRESDQDVNNDKIDIAGFSLNKEQIIEIQKCYTFYDLNNKLPKTNNISNNFILSIGFPLKFNEKKKNKLIVDPLIYSLIRGKPDIYQQKHINETIVELYNLDIKKAVNYKTNKIISLKDLYGISGSGIWSIIILNSAFTGRTPSFVFKGIFTALENKKYAFATRETILVDILNNLN